MSEPCAACWRPARDLHHCVYQQKVRREGGDLSDERNLLALCRRCHESHHWGGRNRLELPLLPDSVYEYAAELLGPPAAYEYLRRRYRGTDPRLDALIDSRRAA